MNITREVLNNYIHYYVLDDTLDKLFDLLESGTNIDHFILQYVNETALIYDTSTDYYISWYKLTHIGRCLQTNLNDIARFDLFMEDLIDTVINYKGV